MRLLHLLIHVIVLAVTCIVYFMWVTPSEEENHFIAQLITLALIYATMALATEWLVYRYFLPYNRKYVHKDDGFVVYDGEDKAIAAAYAELDITNSLDCQIEQGEDDRGTYLWVHDKRYNVNSDKYYYVIKKQPVNS